MKGTFLYALVLTLFGFLNGCQTGLSYDDFHHLDHWDELALEPTNDTIVYLYSPTCQICMSIEDDVLNAFKILETHRTIVLAIEGMMYGQGEPPIAVESVPSLLVYDGKDWRAVRGSQPVLDYLENALKK